MNFSAKEKGIWENGYEFYNFSIKNLNNILNKYSELTGIPVEIAKYEFLKSRNEIIREIINYYKDKIDKNTIVDIGCGNLFLLELLRTKSNALLIGIDFTDKVFVIKKEILFRDRINVVVADAINLPFKESAINCFVSSEVIEHIPKIMEFFSEIFRCLKLKGKIILTTPNKNIGIWRLFNIFHLIKRSSIKKREINNKIKPFEKFVESNQIISILKELKFKNITINYLFHHPGQNWFSFEYKLLNLVLYQIFLKINRIINAFLHSFGRMLIINSNKN